MAVSCPERSLQIHPEQRISLIKSSIWRLRLGKLLANFLKRSLTHPWTDVGIIVSSSGGLNPRNSGIPGGAEAISVFSGGCRSGGSRNSGTGEFSGNLGNTSGCYPRSAKSQPKRTHCQNFRLRRAVVPLYNNNSRYFPDRPEFPGNFPGFRGVPN